MLFLPLNKRHDRQSFDCGDADLNRWFAQVARQHKEKGVSSTFVAVSAAASAEVLGFYSVTITELINKDLPPEQQKRLPEKIPAFRLGRLAVSRVHQGKGIGESLLFDALDRVTRTAAEIAGVGLVVDAKPGAVSFYQQYGFEQMADHPSKLFLPIHHEATSAH